MGSRLQGSAACCKQLKRFPSRVQAAGEAQHHSPCIWPALAGGEKPAQHRLWCARCNTHLVATASSDMPWQDRTLTKEQHVVRAWLVIISRLTYPRSMDMPSSTSTLVSMVLEFSMDSTPSEPTW